MTMQAQLAQSLLSSESTQVTIRIVAVEEGGFTAECPEIPGCFSEGETREEAEHNIRNAIDACLGVIFEDLLQRIKPAAEVPERDQAAILETVFISLPRLAREAA